jgi:hypothetical protein
MKTAHASKKNQENFMTILLFVSISCKLKEREKKKAKLNLLQINNKHIFFLQVCVINNIFQSSLFFLAFVLIIWF